MARDKEFEARMSGMLYAFDIVKKDGVDGLEKEINRRRITKVPMNISQAELNRAWEQLCRNMYNSISITFLYALRESFGFGKERTAKLLEFFNKAVADVIDMDYMGEHYIKLEDYAVEVAEKMGGDFDINIIASCQDTYDKKGTDSNYHKADVDKIIKVLRDAGHFGAAEFLEAKLE